MATTFATKKLCLSLGRLRNPMTFLMEICFLRMLLAPVSVIVSQLMDIKRKIPSNTPKTQRRNARRFSKSADYGAGTL